jgi:hypothetical protein
MDAERESFNLANDDDDFESTFAAFKTVDGTATRTRAASIVGAELDRKPAQNMVSIAANGDETLSHLYPYKRKRYSTENEARIRFQQ